MALVSVVIPNWNGAHLLPTCLDSIRAQTLRDFEVTIADDGSTDGSLALVAARYPEVRIVPMGENLGFSRAVNAGIQASRGEFIALLNNDTELDPRFLEELVGAIREHARLGMCAPKMVYYDDPSLINSAGHACGPDGVVVDIGRGQPDGPWFSRSREVFGACAGAALYRRAMLEQIGLFDPDFLLSFEDADLNWRAQWAGWRCRYVPTAVVKHREGASRGIRSRRAIFLGLRNTAHVWVKDWPALSLLRHLPTIWRGQRRAMASLIFRGYGDVLPAVAWGALVQMPVMLARRRRIRRTRAVPLPRFEELLSGEGRTARLLPFDSGLRLGMLRLVWQAWAAILSLKLLSVIIAVTALADLTERVEEAVRRRGAGRDLRAREPRFESRE
jgi:GT2 family glycosyltransferase